MSLGGGGPLERGDWQVRVDKLAAQADAARAARLAGQKPLLRRLLERLRPHRQEPGSDPQSTFGTFGNPGN
jgi:hypothetical protein